MHPPTATCSLFTRLKIDKELAKILHVHEATIYRARRRAKFTTLPPARQASTSQAPRGEAETAAD